MFKTIRFRLILIAAAPLLYAFVLTAISVKTAYYDLEHMSELEQLVQLANHASTHVHEAQKERGATDVFVGSEGTKFGQELDAQRAETDARRTAFNQTLATFDASPFGSSFKRTLAAAVEKMNQIDEHRMKVSDLSISAEDAIGFYTGHNAAMLDLISEVSKLSDNPHLANSSAAYTNFLQGKERAGIERAVMSETFAADHFGPGKLRKFEDLLAAQDLFFHSFHNLAAPEENAFYQTKLTGPVIDEVQRMRDIAFEREEGRGVRAELVARLLGEFGYGGAIHNFKNYVLRGTPKYRERFEGNFKKANHLLDELESLSTSGEEAQWAASLRKTLTKYHEGIAAVETVYHADKKNVHTADDAVEVDDGPALAALAELSQSLQQGNFGIDDQHWVKTMTAKINLMKEVEDHLSSSLVTEVATLRSSARSSLILVSSIATIVTLFVLSLVFVVTRGIIRPLNESVRYAERIADGDLTTHLNSSRNDEIGQLMTALETMGDTLREVVQNLSENAKTLSGSSTQLSTTATHLTSGAEETTNQSSSVASAAEEMSTNMNNMAASTEQMTLNVKTVASSVEEMTASITEIAKNAEHASTVAGNAAQLVEVSNTNIGQLGQAANEIGNVIETIHDIAEQTNLLALNATIEAARAGDAGKGFAVVATEVKELAKQTADATEDIRRRIEGIQSSTGEAVDSIGQISKVIQQVNDVSSTIASAVEEQSITTKEIAQNVTQTSDASQTVSIGVAESASATQEITRNIAQVDRAARETALGASRTQTAGTELSKLSEELQTLVGKFRV